MVKKLTLVAMMLLIAGAAMAQAPAIGGAVGPQTAPVMLEPSVVPQSWNTPGSDPANGKYDILVNGWIEAYARVSAYDNWISFGVMSPTSGTWAVPVSRWAFSQTTGTGYALTGETGGQSAMYAVGNYPESTQFDLAGIQIQTNARLNLVMDMGGYMNRVDENGYAFVANDTRKLPLGRYQLRNQVKMSLHGKFLTYTDALDPAPDAAGTAFVSPTSGETTTYGTMAGNGWTEWAAGTNAIPNNDGWFEPTASGVDPWSGAGYPASAPLAASSIGALALVVERGQAQDSGTGTAAEVWFTQRILRRGLQDVAGNYRSDMALTLTYREADAQWQPELP